MRLTRSASLALVAAAFAIGTSRVALSIWRSPAWLTGEVRPASMQTSSQRTWLVRMGVAGVHGFDRVTVSCEEPATARILGPREFIDVAAHQQLEFLVSTPLHERTPRVRLDAERARPDGMSRATLIVTP